MNGTRMGPLTHIHTASHTAAKSTTKAGHVGGASMPGTTSSCKSSHTSRPSLIPVSNPKIVGEHRGDDQRHQSTHDREHEYARLDTSGKRWQHVGPLRSLCRGPT